MSKWLHQDVKQNGLQEIKDNATYCCVCSAQPTTQAEAYTTYCLAKVAVSTGDFTWGTVSGVGERLTQSAKTDIPIDSNGTMNHIAWVDGTRLLAVTTAQSMQLQSGGSLIDLPAILLTALNPV